MKSHTLVTFLFLVGAGGACQANPLSVGGQVRPRFEVWDFSGGPHDTFTSTRVRLQVRAALERDVMGFIQLQDVRLWGEEASTLGDFRADNFDLHQGYAELQKIEGSQLSVRVGRQEIAFGGQRLIGAVGWMPQARSLDGLRATVKPDGAILDLIAIRLADETAAGIADNAYLLGGCGTVTRFSASTVDFYLIYNRISGARTNQITSGIRWAGSRKRVTYRVEASLQRGERAGEDISAFLLGGRVGVSFADGKGRPIGWYDLVSGDDDPTGGKVNVFDTLFATNHKFYGFADLFLNLPAHTAGLGLQNLAFKARVTPSPGISLGLDIHSFLLAKRGPTSTKRLAEEVDLTVRYRYSKNVSFAACIAYVLAREGIRDIGRLSDDFRHGYSMMDVSL